MGRAFLRSLMVIVLVSVVALAWGQNDKKLRPVSGFWGRWIFQEMRGTSGPGMTGRCNWPWKKSTR